MRGFTEPGRAVHLPAVNRAAYFIFQSSQRRGRNSWVLPGAARADGEVQRSPPWCCSRQVSRAELAQLSPVCERKRRRKHVMYLVRNSIQRELTEIPPPFIPKPARGRRHVKREIQRCYLFPSEGNLSFLSNSSVEPQTLLFLPLLLLLPLLGPAAGAAPPPRQEVRDPQNWEQPTTPSRQELPSH